MAEMPKEQNVWFEAADTRNGLWNGHQVGGCPFLSRKKCVSPADGDHSRVECRLRLEEGLSDPTACLDSTYLIRPQRGKDRLELTGGFQVRRLTQKLLPTVAPRTRSIKGPTTSG